MLDSYYEHMGQKRADFLTLKKRMKRGGTNGQSTRVGAKCRLKKYYQAGVRDRRE